MSDDRETQRLHAFHDGELSLPGRLAVRRRLARNPAARRELEALERVGHLVREAQAEAPASPDLWAGIRARLPSPAEVERRRPAGAPARPLGWLRWAAPAAAAAAAAALALTFALGRGDAPLGPSVRWLDAEGSPAMVLQDDREATIIWVLESPGRVSEARTRVVG